MCGPSDQALGFDLALPKGGYAWWYFDLISEDGEYALTQIFFIGSVFCPRYFRARSLGRDDDPLDHCGVNAALYKRSGGRWVMTQVPRTRIRRSGHALEVSNSRVVRGSKHILIDLDERCSPWGQALKGEVEVELRDGLCTPLSLDSDGDHGWWPVGANARASVRLRQPRLHFSGSAYHDCNFGRVPLERSFRSWTWSRAELKDGVALLYDTVECSGERRELAFRLGAAGKKEIDAPLSRELGRGFWGTHDSTRSDAAAKPPQIRRRLEDTPFYNRSLLETHIAGEACLAVHESLDLQRFARPWVQFLLPFRMRYR